MTSPAPDRAPSSSTSSPPATPAPSSPAPSSSTRPTSSGSSSKVMESPVLPISLLAAGLYLCWFGVHYWRSDVKWPTDPIKALLTGKPIPDATKSQDQQQLAQDWFQNLFGGSFGPVLPGAGGEAPAGGAGAVFTGANSQIAVTALKYSGSGYVFGGNADRVGNWDCSSFVFYVLAHDLGLSVLGHKWGDPGVPPHAHGPVASQYKLIGIGVSRPAAGDVVAWNTHVGIALDANRIVSARTPAEGVGTSTIDGTSRSINEVPTFRRIQLGSAI